MNERYSLDGAQIKQFLKDRSLKQTYLIKGLNVSGSLLAQMLAGHVPQESTLNALAHLMGIEVSTLLIPKDSAKAG